MCFSSEIDEKSMEKLVSAILPAKIEKMTALDSPFSFKNEFLSNFGVPRRSQKSSLKGEQF